MKKTLHEISEHYTASLQEHGAVAAGVGWGNEEKHAIRFEQLLQLVQGETAPFSVNDLGCGYGALIGELEARGHSLDWVHGYDISAPMLDEAKARYGARETVEFREESVLRDTADYSFASGIFNVRFSEDDDSWQSFIFDTLDNMNAMSRKGFAFNLLSSYVDWKSDDLFYADPSVFFDHCKRNYSRQVALLHDTPLYEWTMIVRKP